MSSDRVALVTGAGSGIGRSVALALAGQGFRVVASGRSSQPLFETVALMPSGARGLARTVDVSSQPSVAGLFDFIRAECGRLDFLFNNAGASVAGRPVDEVDPDDWRRLFDTNVTGSFLCARAAFALMKVQDPQGGRIVNNGSVSAQVPRLNSAAYTASKHAITGLTKSIALDGRAFGIACGQIDIGNADTTMASAMPAGVLQADGGVAAEPVFAVEHVASTVAHMASLPLEVNIPFLTLMATGMPFMGRG